MAAVLEAICAERGGALEIVKVNAAEHGQRAVALGVRAVPTFVLFSRGQPIASTTGSIPKTQFERWIDTELARTTLAGSRRDRVRSAEREWRRQAPAAMLRR